MINWFLRRKTINNGDTLTSHEIQQSEKILFALFTRYGDTIIDLVVIREFIQKFPKKKYLVICPKQMEPYVIELLPKISYFSFNKRNIFQMIKVNKMLQSWGPDIGFNPWSHGLDSCYFLNYCKRYQCYRDFFRPKEINHYQVVRRYLNLPEEDWVINKIKSRENYREILVCPQSTDPSRSISEKGLDQIIKNLWQNYDDSKITIAAKDTYFFRSNCNQFKFRKNKQSSENFIRLIKQSDLVICADSAPLHIAIAFKKHTQVIFLSTKPEIVLNSGSSILNA